MASALWPIVFKKETVMNKFMNIILLIAAGIIMSGCSVAERINYYESSNPNTEVINVPTWDSKYIIIDTSIAETVFKFVELDCNGIQTKIFRSITISELEYLLKNNNKTESVIVDDTITITSKLIWRVDQDELIYIKDNRFMWIWETDAGKTGGSAELVHFEKYVNGNQHTPNRIKTQIVYITNYVDIAANGNSSVYTNKPIQQTDVYDTIDFNFHKQ